MFLISKRQMSFNKISNSYPEILTVPVLPNLNSSVCNEGYLISGNPNVDMITGQSDHVKFQSERVRSIQFTFNQNQANNNVMFSILDNPDNQF